jgi:hypothetical protein
MMKHRFQTDHKGSFRWTVLLSVAVFLGVLLLFCTGVNHVSGKAAAEEQQLLEQALQRSIAHCYAIEGRYPESLAYLEKNYGLTYNKKRFYVDYQPIGSDLWPDVTILNKEGTAP